MRPIAPLPSRRPRATLLAPLLCAVAILLGLQAGTARAWSASGHRIVAAMAEARLTPATKARIRPLLAESGARSLADVAAWADEVRKEGGELGKATARLHYVKFTDRSCHARECPDGGCIVAAIDRYAGVLADRARPEAERAEALRFLVHFVGDVHQPLHSGYRDDRGGNHHQVQLAGKGRNLHWVWDHGILQSRQLGWAAYADAIQPRADMHGGGTPLDWAVESCRITRDTDLYPRTRKLGRAYLDAMRPIAERRLRLAAIRLAERLEQALGEPGAR